MPATMFSAPWVSIHAHLNCWLLPFSAQRVVGDCQFAWCCHACCIPAACMLCSLTVTPGSTASQLSQHVVQETMSQQPYKALHCGMHQLLGCRQPHLRPSSSPSFHRLHDGRYAASVWPCSGALGPSRSTRHTAHHHLSDRGVGSCQGSFAYQAAGGSGKLSLQSHTTQQTRQTSSMDML